MKYAPIIIPTLCRDEHFIRQIESLKRNEWAKYTDVYIGLDYPAKELHWEGYKKICDYLSGNFNEFASFNIIKREKNFGASKNLIELRREVIESKQYDRFITTDDDCEFSPNFLEFIDKALNEYENDESVIAVTAYTHPVTYSIRGGFTAFKNQVMFPLWGTGFWVKRFNKMREDLYSGYMRKKFLEGAIKRSKLTDARYIDAVAGSLTKNEESLLRGASDLAFSCYMQLEGKYVVAPSLSLVRNYGFDGSGVYCEKAQFNGNKRITTKNYRYDTQEIDQNIHFNLLVDEESSQKKNKIVINTFEPRSPFEIMKAAIKGKTKKLLYEIGIYIPLEDRIHQ